MRLVKVTQRKVRKDKGKERGPTIFRRKDSDKTSVVLPRVLVAELRRRWPNRTSATVLIALQHTYGARPPGYVDLGCAAPACLDPVTLTIRLPRAWIVWGQQQRASMGALVSHALVSEFYL